MKHDIRVFGVSSGWYGTIDELDHQYQRKQVAILGPFTSDVEAKNKIEDLYKVMFKETPHFGPVMSGMGTGLVWQQK